MSDLLSLLLVIGLLILTIWFGVKIASSVFRGAFELLDQASNFGFVGLVLYIGAWFFMLPIMLIWAFIAGLDGKPKNFADVGLNDKPKKSANSASIARKHLAPIDMASRDVVSRRRPLDLGILDSLDQLPHDNVTSNFNLDLGEQGCLPNHKWYIYRPKILPPQLEKFPVTFYFFYHQRALFADNFLQITHHGQNNDHTFHDLDRLKGKVEWIVRHEGIGSGPVSDLVVEYRANTVNEHFTNTLLTSYKKGSHIHHGYNVHIANQSYSFSIECTDQEFEGLFRAALKSAMQSFRLQESA